MSKTSSGLAAGLLIILPAVAIIGTLAWSYNGIVTKEEKVFSAWSQVESNYQRRADLVPNLVKTVQAYADHEISAVIAVADDRAESLKALALAAQEANATTKSATQTLSGGTEKLSDTAYIKNVAAAQNQSREKISVLLAMTEAYPALRASDNFLALQDQLEGAENRINTARMSFNETAQTYNAAIRRLPGSLLANLGGFQRKAYFEAGNGAEKSPTIDFGNR